jgi:hypothetical protein
LTAAVFPKANIPEPPGTEKEKWLLLLDVCFRGVEQGWKAVVLPLSGFGVKASIASK